MLPHFARLTGLHSADLFLPTVASSCERRVLYIDVGSQLLSREAGLRADWSLGEGAVVTNFHTHLTSVLRQRACLVQGPTRDVVPHVDSVFCHLIHDYESACLNGGMERKCNKDKKSRKTDCKYNMLQSYVCTFYFSTFIDCVAAKKSYLH